MLFQGTEGRILFTFIYLSRNFRADRLKQFSLRMKIDSSASTGYGFHPMSAPAKTSTSGAAISLAALVEDLLPAGVVDSGMNSALPAIYNELRDLAAGYLRHERPDHTLQPTALVH